MEIPWAAGETLSWEQVKAEALTQAEDLAINRTEQAIVTTQTREAKSDYFPQIRLRASIERLENLDKQSVQPPISIVGNTSFVNVSQFQVSPGATVSWTLWDGGQRKRRVQATQMRLIQKTEEAYIKERDVLLKTLKAYADSLNAQTRKKYLRQVIDAYDTLMEASKRLFDAGVIRKTEIAEIALELFNAREELTRATTDWQVGLTELGYWTRTTYPPDDTELNALDNSVTLPIQILLENLPEYRQYTAAIDEKEFEIQRLRRERWAPTITAYSNLNLYGRDARNLARALGDTDLTNLTVGVTAQWLVFDGFKLAAQTERAQLEKIRLVQLREKTVRELMHEVESAKVQYAGLSAMVHAQTETAEVWAKNDDMWQRLDSQRLVRHSERLKQAIARHRDAMQQALAGIDQLAVSQKLNAYLVGVP